MQPGDRLVCALIDPPEQGATFRNWPLHITVVPWFRVDIQSAQLAAQLSAALASVRTFKVRLDGTAKFGRGEKKLVHLVAEPTPLHEVEQCVRALLRRYGAWLVDETTKVRKPYRPHVTNQAQTAAQEGMVVNVGALYIIEQRGGVKEVAGKVELAS